MPAPHHTTDPFSIDLRQFLIAQKEPVDTAAAEERAAEEFRELMARLAEPNRHVAT